MSDTTETRPSLEASHWTYCDPDTERWQCQMIATREEAIAEGLGELDGDRIEVIHCHLGLPPCPDLDVDELMEMYMMANEDLFLEGYEEPLNIDYELKPALRAELEAAVAPHWDAIKGILLGWLKKHAGEIHIGNRGELIERPEPK